MAIGNENLKWQYTISHGCVIDRFAFIRADELASKLNDWILFYSMDHLEYKQARLIEKHIKRMKSRKYIEDLKKYESISFNLIKLYS